MRAKALLMAALTAVLAALACGPSTPTVNPVKQQVLTGTIGGQPFTFQSGTASGSKVFGNDGGEKWIDVYDAPAIDCSVFSPGAQRELLGTIPWQVKDYDLNLVHNLTLLSMGSHNDIATSGRVEIVSAPPPDAGPATIRIRAYFDADNTVEGEVQLQVCD